ncbi:hypothetical protein [Streptomyces sp. NPDC053048]|uniref:hypothetical protein n=1 Tax=Streptomyces sp. NPDC053048 TaxID=3365694 RepID=UPI0037D56C14
MNSVPHLLAEDRPEFERILDQALRTAKHDPELAVPPGHRLQTEQLRAMAISAMSAISACAMAEYQEFLGAREALRARSAAARPQPAGSVAARPDETGPPSPVTAPADVPEDEGAGAGAVIAVLAPVLAGIAAFLFLLIGYVMRTVGAGESVARPMITVGWWFGAFTVAGVLVAMSGMLRTALRNGQRAEEAPPRDELTEEAERAHEAWRRALLARGILPFLREVLAKTPPAPRRPRSPRNHTGPSRTPHLGYSRPGFSSPDTKPSAPSRSAWPGPDLTGPDTAGPDRRAGD